jgi:hypothetical protein
MLWLLLLLLLCDHGCDAAPAVLSLLKSGHLLPARCTSSMALLLIVAADVAAAAAAAAAAVQTML